MKATFLSLFILAQSLLHSQNLVPNWSFEDTLQCPYQSGQIDYALPWFKPTAGTSDYCNECSSAGPSIPNNYWGHQYAMNGKGYAGLVTYCVTCPPFVNQREYISVRLTDSLIAGRQYCVQFYVSPGEVGGVACDQISAYFSNDSIASPITTNLPYVPQINNTHGIISDTVNWTLVSGEFTSGGGEKYITIGNFQTDANTNIDTIGNSPLGCYYYIDDVSVEEMSSCNAGQDAAICLNDSFQIGTVSDPAVTYLWNPTNGLSNNTIGNPKASPQTTTTYTLTQTQCGTITTSTVTVTVDHDCNSASSIFIPTILKGSEQLFIQGLEPNSLLAIFDMRGRIVYSLQDYDNEFSVFALAKGDYVVRLTRPGGEVIGQKLCVVK